MCNIVKYEHPAVEVNMTQKIIFPETEKAKGLLQALTDIEALVNRRFEDWAHVGPARLCIQSPVFKDTAWHTDHFVWTHFKHFTIGHIQHGAMPGNSVRFYLTCDKGGEAVDYYVSEEEFFDAIKRYKRS